MLEDVLISGSFFSHAKRTGCAHAHAMTPQRAAFVLWNRNGSQPWNRVTAPHFFPISRAAIRAREIRRDRETSFIGHDLAARFIHGADNGGTARFRAITAIDLVILCVDMEM